MINFARRIGGLAGPVAALVAVALASTSASAATANSVSISGPRSATAGQRIRLRFTGYAAPDVRRLKVWLDNRKCAMAAKAESARPELQPPAPPPSQFKVSGQYRAVLRVDRSSTGTHIVCAYLLYAGTQTTAARATWRYVTHRVR